MSLLNPFFRQSIQDPGMDIKTTPRPTPAIQTNQESLELQMLENKSKAVDSALDLAVVWANAEAQIKEEENQLTLKKTATEIKRDSGIMVNGFTMNENFKVGNIDISTGEKGFHSYSSFDDQKKSIKMDMVSRLQKKYNPEGNDKLNELIKLQVEGGLIDSFYSSDVAIRKNISDMALADIEERSIGYLNQFKHGDYKSVFDMDAFVNKKFNEGSISEQKAIQTKIAWRKKAWSQIVKEMNAPNATYKDKEAYLKLYGEAVDNLKDLSKLEKDDPKRQFLQYLSISDLQDINRSYGASAYTPDKNRQKFEVESLFMNDAESSIRRFGGQIQINTNKKGEPKSVSIVSMMSVTANEKIPNTGAGTLLKKYNLTEQELIDLNPNHEEDLKAHFEGDKIGPLDLVIKKTDDTGWHSHIRQQLNTLGYDQIDPLEVQKILKSQESKIFKEASLHWNSSTFEEYETEINADLTAWSRKWSVMFQHNPSTRMTEKTANAQRPSVPYLDEESLTGAGWDSLDSKMIKLKNHIGGIHSQMIRTENILDKINAGLVVSDEALFETEREIFDIELMINSLPSGGQEINVVYKDMALRFVRQILGNKWHTYKSQLFDKNGGRIAMCEKLAVNHFGKKYEMGDKEMNRGIMNCAKGGGFD